VERRGGARDFLTSLRINFLFVEERVNLRRWLLGTRVGGMASRLLPGGRRRSMCSSGVHQDRQLGRCKRSES
jgi:hypothetical protein